MSKEPIYGLTWGVVNFIAYPRYEEFNNFPGIYIFAKEFGDLQLAIYIGQSEEIGDRIEEQKLDPEIFGYTDKINVIEVQDKRLRDVWERCLIEMCNPPRNEKHRTGPTVPELASIVKDRY